MIVFQISLNFGPVKEIYTENTMSDLQILFKKVVLKNLANFTGKHMCWSLFLVNLPALQNT